MKIGILGGTFNPPHLGHLRLAEEVAYEHGLSRVIFIPCFTPPHKSSNAIAASDHRLEMTRRACEGNRLFEVSNMEISLYGTSYTVDTLKALAEDQTREIFFVMGTDSLKEISTWKDYDRLFLLSHFIVAIRPGIHFDQAWKQVPESVRSLFRHEEDRLVHSGSKLLIPSKVCGLDISSTRIRTMARTGQSIRYLVPESVRLYIIENHLYGC